MIVPRHYENLEVLHENTMPYRAYYIPASKRMGILAENRQDSDRISMLNGDWKFKYYGVGFMKVIIGAGKMAYEDKPI